MTAQYWVWKNIHDIDYVGFVITEDSKVNTLQMTILYP